MSVGSNSTGQIVQSTAYSRQVWKVFVLVAVEAVQNSLPFFQQTTVILFQADQLVRSVASRGLRAGRSSRGYCDIEMKRGTG